MQAELRAYLDSFNQKDKDSDAGQMQVSDVIDQKREGWRSVEDATMAYHQVLCCRCLFVAAVALPQHGCVQATMELTQLVGTVSHQHNKIVLERLCSTVSSLAGFHCMVGEMMKSLLPAVTLHAVSLYSIVSLFLLHAVILSTASCGSLLLPEPSMSTYYFGIGALFPRELW